MNVQGFVSNNGDVIGRLNATYDVLITNRLVLEPELEFNYLLYRGTSEVTGRRTDDLELSLRLRYEITREFAPYVGISWDRKIARASLAAQSEGEENSSFALVAGIRFWF